MSITITVPDAVVIAAQAEASANGSTIEEYLLGTFTARFALSHTLESSSEVTEARSSSLLSLIGLANGGPTDSSIYHDYRPGDAV